MFKNIKKYLVLILMCSSAALLTSCASIMETPLHSVRIDSEPQNVSYTIIDKDGDQVATGTTPDTVVLRTSAGIFQKSRYYVDFESPGYVSQTKKLDAKIAPWYWINVIVYVPGFLGALIIDPFTGAMFTLPDEANAAMEAQ